MREFAETYAGKSASMDDFKTIAEKYYGEQLTWFFSQWLDSTGAPEFKLKYTTYRLGSNKGFRVTGEISQDLDLFRMPVDLRIDTDGKTKTRSWKWWARTQPSRWKLLDGRGGLQLIPTTMLLTKLFGCEDAGFDSARDKLCSSRATSRVRWPSFKQSARTEQEQFAGALPHRGDFFPAEKLSVVRRTPTVPPSTATEIRAGRRFGAISS